MFKYLVLSGIEFLKLSTIDSLALAFFLIFSSALSTLHLNQCGLKLILCLIHNLSESIPSLNIGSFLVNLLFLHLFALLL